VITGNKTVVTGTLDEPGGGVQTWTTIITKHGQKTTTDKTITQPDGTVEYQKSVSTDHGNLDSTTTGTSQIPSNDSILYSSSATNVTRVQPPSS
jgi:hypothetical protein